MSLCLPRIFPQTKCCHSHNRFFRHQACYCLLPAKPGGQADRDVSLCKYKVVDWDSRTQREGMGLLEYQVMPSLLFVAHDGVLCTVSNGSAPDGSTCCMLGHLLQPARQAAVLGKPSSIRTHCSYTTEYTKTDGNNAKLGLQSFPLDDTLWWSVLSHFFGNYLGRTHLNFPSLQLELMSSPHFPTDKVLPFT